MTATSLPIAEASSRAGAGANRAHAFEAAKRHSNLVQRLRWAVPASAAFIILLAIASWGISRVNIGGFSIDGVTLSGGRIAMTTPVLRGLDQDGRPYEITAQRALQSVSANPEVTLRDVEALFGMDEDESATIQAPQARYDTDAATIDFDEGGVEVELSSGVSVWLGVAHLNVDDGTLKSDEPVRVESGELSLRATGLEAFDGGERIVFTGPVQVTLTPAASQSE